MLKTVFAVFLILLCTGKTNLMEKSSVVVLPVPYTDGEGYVPRNTFRVPIPKLMLKQFSFQGHDSWVWLVNEMTQEFCKNIFYENSKFYEDFKARATDLFPPPRSPRHAKETSKQKSWNFQRLLKKQLLKPNTSLVK